MMAELLGPLLALLGFAFSLGGAAFFVKQLRKDLNGLGNFTRIDIKKAHEKRLNNLDKAMLLVSKNDPEGRRIARLLGERGDGPEEEEITS